MRRIRISRLYTIRRSAIYILVFKRRFAVLTLARADATYLRLYIPSRSVQTTYYTYIHPYYTAGLLLFFPRSTVAVCVCVCVDLARFSFVLFFISDFLSSLPTREVQAASRPPSADKVVTSQVGSLAAPLATWLYITSRDIVF